jgi:hypothetical protein
MKWDVVLCLAVMAAPLAAQFAPGTWHTDKSKRSIDLNELKLGGPPKDGIPALNLPKFVPTAQAKAWLDAKEPVIVVEHTGEVRAYPLQILIWHELVNDQIGDAPVLVSYCPLCNSAVVFDRRVDATVYDFGVSGMLRVNDMVMFDRQTDSLWQQITGECIVGKMTGSQLSILPSQTVAFGLFASQFPQGKVLSRSTGYARRYGQNPYVGYEFSNQLLFPVRKPANLRVPLMERIVGITGEKDAKAYSFRALRRVGVTEGRVGDKHYVIFFQDGTRTALDAADIARSRDVGAVGVFSPESEGRILTFQREDGRIVDQQTGSAWNLLGIALSGPLAGRRLTPVEHVVSFAFAWLVFRPDTQLIDNLVEP